MNQNQLIIICGPPASGKSTYARNLAKEKHCCLLDIDTVTETLVHKSLTLLDRDPNDRDSSYFKSNYRDPIYQTLFKIAKENLKHVNTIIVGPFTKELNQKDWNESLEEEFQCQVQILFTTCSKNLRYQRMVNRGESRDLPKLENWDTYLKYYGNDAHPKCVHQVINTESLN